MLQRIVENPDARALYLYPTKALTYDQLDDLMQWANGLAGEAETSACIPTTATRRRMRAPPSGRAATSSSAIRTCCTRASCRTTRSGRSCLRICDFIVVDELHTYRGVFGSHLANLFRRLARICEFYGSKPQFICTSATIANPKELAENLTGQPFEFIDESGAGEGEKHVFFYNPPVVNRQLGIRRSYVKEAQHIAAAFLKRNIPAIVFANSRLDHGDSGSLS